METVRVLWGLVVEAQCLSVRVVHSTKTERITSNETLGYLTYGALTRIQRHMVVPLQTQLHD